MARYLVTGGAGFIGSHLTSLLVRRGHDVCILDNLSTGRLTNIPERAHFIMGDVRDQRLVSQVMAEVDGCFHLAAIASVEACNDDWFGAHQTNLGGAINVFETALRVRERPLPVVYASSAAVYGDCQDTPLTEDAATRPLSVYGADKLGCEQHARAAAVTRGLGSMGMRFFNVYGPRQDPRSPYSGVISVFAGRLATDAPVTINGDGEQTRDFVYVADVCQALWHAMQNCRPGVAEVFNVCTGHEVSVQSLAETLSRLLASHASIEHGPPRPGDIRRSVGSPRHLMEELGISPSTNLETGLQATLEWIRVDHGQPREVGDRGHAGVSA